VESASARIARQRRFGREIAGTKRLSRCMLGDGQARVVWLGNVHTVYADDYKNGAPEIL